MRLASLEPDNGKNCNAKSDSFPVPSSLHPVGVVVLDTHRFFGGITELDLN